jgi:hypothetical protein
MPGLSLNSGLRFRASSATQLGTANPGTIDAAAFSPGVTQSPQTRGQALSPSTPQGFTFWVGVGSILILAIIRHSLPK